MNHIEQVDTAFKELRAAEWAAEQARNKFQQAIKTARSEGVSAYKLAQELGVAQSTIGRNTPKDTVLITQYMPEVLPGGIVYNSKHPEFTNLAAEAGGRPIDVGVWLFPHDAREKVRAMSVQLHDTPPEFVFADEQEGDEPNYEKWTVLMERFSR